ncbi:DUF4393 domain-containing protein [Pseudomonas syringae]|nr:DUF4393 domain-containing protein [Pseudomonas syringae]
MAVPEIKVEVSADLTDVAEGIYSDALKDTFKEVSKIGVDAAKAIRLIAAPVQIAAALQDNLSRWIDRAIRNIPDADRISPPPSLLIPILDNLKYRFDDDLIGEMYSNLLSKVFDSKGFGQAHPSFVTILSQISPDEAQLVKELSEGDGKLFFSTGANDWASSFEGIIERLVILGGDRVSVELFHQGAVNPKNYGQPNYLSMYVEHMATLGLVTWVNNESSDLFSAIGGFSYTKDVHKIRLTSFGWLFYKACVQGLSGIVATPENRV